MLSDNCEIREIEAMFLRLHLVRNKALSGTISHFAVYLSEFNFESRSKANNYRFALDRDRNE